MLIEIHGAGYVNKGAQLMLETVVAKMQETSSDLQLCIAAGQDRPPKRVGQLGLRFLWPSNCLFARGGKFAPYFHITRMLGSVTPKKLLRPYGLVRRNDVDAVIDISGYAFGDKWGATSARNFSRVTKYYKSRGCPVIFLPQMFGPFDNAADFRTYQALFDSCDLIFARDTDSHSAIKKVMPNHGNISLAPDITIFNNAYRDIEPILDTEKKYATIVPNARLLDKGTRWTEDTYIDALANAGKKILDAGVDLKLVVHETRGKDGDLANQIRNQIGLGEDCIYASEDPNSLKAFIGQSEFLIGSRFHSLVAALSTATPSIAIGWAHKYGQLLKDFGVEEFNIAKFDDHTRIPNLVEKLLNTDMRNSICEGLKSSKNNAANENSKMWKSVFDLLQIDGVSC